MRLPRPRFTVRRLMVVVAIAGIAFWLVRGIVRSMRVASYRWKMAKEAEKWKDAAYFYGRPDAPDPHKPK
jgi:hypothetical protein